jgi:hypothetical protein
MTVNLFWDKIIRKILEAENVKNIVEIGALKGDNTEKILNYCKQAKGKLMIIDPKPQMDVDQLNHDYPGLFELYEDLSLNILPKLDGYDAVLIDGDHNWYTVYHELKIIEENAKKNRRFPTVFLHDIGWPYGRRDLYYNPGDIPRKFRKPYAKKGIARGQSALIDPDDNEENLKLINPTMNNALYENGKQNGVLTAVEDFLKETKFPISFHRVNHQFGLGILLPREPKRDRVIRNIMQKANL